MAPSSSSGKSLGSSHYGVSGGSLSSSGKKQSKPQSKTKKAGIIFPVGRIARHLKSGRYAKRIGAGAPIFMAAVMEYMVAEVLDLAVKIAGDQEKTRITPRHVQLAIRGDDELAQFLGNVIIANGGVNHAPQEYSHTPVQEKKKKSNVASLKREVTPPTEDFHQNDEEDEEEEDEEEEELEEKSSGHPSGSLGGQSNVSSPSY